jgi:hypothetical protein
MRDNQLFNFNGLTRLFTHKPTLPKARRTHSFLISFRPLRQTFAGSGLPLLPLLIRHSFIQPAFTLPKPKRACHPFCPISKIIRVKNYIPNPAIPSNY